VGCADISSQHRPCHQGSAVEIDLPHVQAVLLPYVCLLNDSAQLAYNTGAAHTHAEGLGLRMGRGPNGE